MADTKTTLTWLLRDQVSGTAKDIDHNLSKLGVTAKNTGGKGGLGGLAGGLLGTVNPALLAATAVGALVGGILEAGNQAAKEQVNITKLNESLKANVAGWNGNTDAIEALISKRELLAFSDDEQRASMALLVGSTHDVTAAQDLQAIAMDLARFKGIDLATATTAIAKASQGSTRELKALGIEIDDNATAAQNLATIQATVAGQAAGYAATTAGKFEAMQIKLGDAIEKLGVAMIPVFNAIADSILAVIPAIEKIIDALGRVIAQAQKAIGKLGRVAAGTSKTDDWAPWFDPFGIQKHAAGGPIAPGALSWVGEQGPELIRMGSRGGQVYSAGQSAQMMGGGGSPVTLNVQLDGRTIAKIVDEHLYYALRRAAPIAR